MKNNEPAILALDTSNYTTSIAVVDKDKNIIMDLRKILKVKQGERGLRQSHALFQHNQNVPALLKECFNVISPSRVAAIAVSSRPRPVEGSYMPVFTSGLSFGQVLSATLEIPLLEFSHQEGHIAAGAFGTEINLRGTYLAFHLSGGTTEVLHIKDGLVNMIGESKDISFGQLIDRVGVGMGLDFPAGKEMDRLALSAKHDGEELQLKSVHFRDMSINLSGLETQILKIIQMGLISMEKICFKLLETIADALILWAEIAVKKTGCKQILFMGGVASSQVIRNIVAEHVKDKEESVVFGLPSLSSDNAVGTGLLGVNKIWL